MIPLKEVLFSHGYFFKIPKSFVKLTKPISLETLDIIFVDSNSFQELPTLLDQAKKNILCLELGDLDHFLFIEKYYRLLLSEKQIEEVEQENYFRNTLTGSYKVFHDFLLDEGWVKFREIANVLSFESGSIVYFLYSYLTSLLYLESSEKKPVNLTYQDYYHQTQTVKAKNFDEIMMLVSKALKIDIFDYIDVEVHR